MILDKPFNVGHFGEKGQTCVIYSTDVHPDGTRFATGGGDHRVKIWSMAAFREPPAASVPSSSATPPPIASAAISRPSPSAQVQGELSLLAVLPLHTASVQCVRWSHDGRYLASASDDTYVLIWELRPDAPSSAPFGASDKPNIENWTRVWVLRGHTMDVLDCAWSPDDSMVASCSIDNTVIVWRIPSTSNGQPGPGSFGASMALTPFKRLRRHKSFVKGVAWDPMGRFLASIGEDNRLLVWRVGGDWGVETTLMTPFDGCEDTLVRRISWSPDGQCLVATNSKDRDIHRAVVFFRGRWEEKPTSLVGHTACTLAASFSPAIYYKPAPTSPKPVIATAAKGAPGDASSAASAASPTPKAGKSKAAAHQVVAIAGQDKVVTVWLAAAKRPVAILREVFDKPPSDLSWGADGYTLVASGHDGTVVVLRFTPEELGLPLSETERAAHFVKVYGADAGVLGSKALDTAPSLIDNPRQLALERSLQQEAKTASSVTMGRTAAVAATTKGINGTGQQVRTLVPRPRPIQTESRSKGGKRRIQPTLLTSNGENSSPSPSVPLWAAPPPPRWEGTDGVPGTGTVSEGFGSSNGSHKRPRTGSGGGVGAASSGSSSSSSGGQSGQHSSTRNSQQHSTHAVGVRQQPPVVVRLRSAGLLSSSSSLPLPLVSPPELMPRRGATGSLVRQISGGGSDSGAFRSPSRLREASSFGGEDHCSGMGEVGSGMGFGGGSDRRSAGIRRSGGGDKPGGANKIAVLECSALDSEFRGLPARRYTMVTVTRGGQEAWRDYVAGMVTSCCGNARIAAVGAEDGSVYVYDRSGARSSPPLVISPPVAYLECNESPPPAATANPLSAAATGDQLMAISGDGDVFVWNLSSMTLTSKSSLGPIFRSMSTSSPASSQGATRKSSAAGPSPSSPGSPSSSRQANASSATASGGGGGKGGVSVARAGVTAEGMPLVMLACPGAFGGSLQAFALHGGLGTWVRVADGRFALSDFYSSGPCTAVSKAGTLSALQAGVRTGSAPTPAALLQASKLGVGGVPGVGSDAAAAEAGRRESLRLAVTRGHLEDSLATAALLGSRDEFACVLKSYAGHLAKNASLGDARVRALCDKLLVASDGSTMERGATPARGPGQGYRGSELLGLRLGDKPSVLGLNKVDLLKEVVLPALSGNRNLQRLVSEYYDGLEFSSASPVSSARPTRNASLQTTTTSPQTTITSPQTTTTSPQTTTTTSPQTTTTSPQTTTTSPRTNTGKAPQCGASPSTVTSISAGRSGFSDGGEGGGSGRSGGTGKPTGGSSGVTSHSEATIDVDALSKKTPHLENEDVSEKEGAAGRNGARDDNGDADGAREIEQRSAENGDNKHAPVPSPSLPSENSSVSSLINGDTPPALPTGEENGGSEFVDRVLVDRSVEHGDVKGAGSGPSANGNEKGKGKARGVEPMKEGETMVS